MSAGTRGFCAPLNEVNSFGRNTMPSSCPDCIWTQCFQVAIHMYALYPFWLWKPHCCVMHRKYRRLEIARVGHLVAQQEAPSPATMIVRLLGKIWMMQALFPLNLVFRAPLLGFNPYKRSSFCWPPRMMHLHASSCIAFAVAKWGIGFWFESFSVICPLFGGVVCDMWRRDWFPRFSWPCCRTGSSLQFIPFVVHKI